MLPDQRIPVGFVLRVMVFNMFINKLDFLHELSNLLGTAPAYEQGEVVRDPELPSANQLVHVEGV